MVANHRGSGDWYSGLPVITMGRVGFSTRPIFFLPIYLTQIRDKVIMAQ